MIRVTSPADVKYNCVAWAANDTKRIWWPDEDYYWPTKYPAIETIDNFVEAFEILGYEACDDDSLEYGCYKIAIFVNAEERPTHVARQLESGEWTSKLGALADVGHDLHDLSHDKVLSIAFGKVAVIMKAEKWKLNK